MRSNGKFPNGSQWMTGRALSFWVACNPLVNFKSGEELSSISECVLYTIQHLPDVYRIIGGCSLEFFMSILNCGGACLSEHTTFGTQSLDLITRHSVSFADQTVWKSRLWSVLVHDIRLTQLSKINIK